MLQIISGKFFDTEDRFHTECKSVFYSNACFRGRHQFAHITMESTESYSDVSTYIITYDNQLQKLDNKGFRPVKIGDEEIIFQFTNIIAFSLNCIVDKDKSTVKNICFPDSISVGREHTQSDFITSTSSSKKDISEMDIKNAGVIIDKIIGLSRTDYNNVLNCIIAYNDSIRLLSTDVSLAYSMLVYCIEALAQKYDHYNATWDDYDQELKNQLEKIFQDVEPSKAEEIRKMLISDRQFKLSQRFKDFVITHVNDSYFTNIIDRFTIGKDDLNIALNNAYIMRSRYAHMLAPIMSQLTDSSFSKAHDTIVFQHNVYFTYCGLLRLVREVITNFILSQPYLKFEEIDWYGQLPNTIEVEPAPYFWIWKEDPKGKFATVKFEGFIDCYVNFKNDIPNMNDLILHYLNYLSQMNSENRSAAFSLSYIYYSQIGNIEIADKNKMKLVIGKNMSLLNQCNIYNIVAALFMVELPEDLEWKTSDLLEVIKEYRYNKYKKNHIKLPNEIDLLLYLVLANSYKDENDIENQLIWLNIAYYNSNNYYSIQKYISECIVNKDEFNLGLIWDEIHNKNSTRKENSK